MIHQVCKEKISSIIMKYPNMEIRNLALRKLDYFKESPSGKPSSVAGALLYVSGKEIPLYSDMTQPHICEFIKSCGFTLTEMTLRRAIENTNMD